MVIRVYVPSMLSMDPAQAGWRTMDQAAAQSIVNLNPLPTRIEIDGRPMLLQQCEQIADRLEPATMRRMQRPSTKVAAGGVAGAATSILVWILGQLGVEVPPEVAAAMATVIAFAASYLIPEKPQE